MKVVYTKHLRIKLKVRKIPFEYPKKIYKKPDQEFIDTIQRRHIAIKKLRYNKKIRNMMIAYDKKEDKIEIVTIHPIKKEKIIKRIMNNRWVEHEKEI